MKKIVILLAFVFVVVLLGGCGTKGGSDQDMDQTGSDSTTPSTFPVDDSTDMSGDSMDAGMDAGMDASTDLRSRRTVYFDFDSSKVHDEDRAIIDAHVQYLTNNPRVSVKLEGHADERGTREYNMALGERRAKSVRQYMLLKGVSSRQLTDTSYGEEKPVAFGHDEASWSKNRRVELIYR